jgi:7-cyano-7-deazaguanine synthase in queuosine biosynthesis
MKDQILLFSGGLDSLIAWYYLGKPDCLFVNMHHKYAMQELETIQQIVGVTNMRCIHDDRIALGDKEQPDAYIPMRNAFLAEIGALYAEKIWVISQKGEMNIPDRSEQFFSQTTEYLRFLNNNPRIEVDTPFRNMSKVDMVRWYLAKDYPVDILKLSLSCYNGDRCGRCSSCFRRWVSFELNGLEDEFMVSPWKTDLAQQYLFKATHGLYDADRSNEIIAAMEKREMPLLVSST